MPARRILVSRNGGEYPAWNSTGHELYWISRRGPDPIPPKFLAQDGLIREPFGESVVGAVALPAIRLGNFGSVWLVVNRLILFVVA
jgi:hypothetical protein